MRNVNRCLVLEQKVNNGTLGKHEAHPAHEWWYTSYGGGHQLSAEWVPSGIIFPDGTAHDEYEGTVHRWYCPGRDVKFTHQYRKGS